MPQYPVIDSSSAIKDYNKKFSDFQEIIARIRPKDVPLMPQGEPVLTLGDYLLQSGYPNSMSAKMNLAKQLGMNNYLGTADQDNALMMALQAGNQKKSEAQKMNIETDFKNKDYSLKEKELGLKEQELNAMKTPSSDEIANSLMKQIQ